MGRYVHPAGGGYFDLQSTAFGSLTTAPYTMACMAYPYVSGDIAGGGAIYLMVQGKIALYFWSQQAFFHLTTNEVSGGAVPYGSWVHCAGTYDGTNLRVWVNGANVGSTTCTETLGTDTMLHVGWLGGGSLADNFDGILANVGIWTALLTIDELTALSRGVSPARIRPNALIVHLPLAGTGRFEDPGREVDLAPNGQTSFWSHPDSSSGGPVMPPIYGVYGPTLRPGPTVYTSAPPPPPSGSKMAYANQVSG